MQLNEIRFLLSEAICLQYIEKNTHSCTETFHTNPQYHTKLSPEAAEDDGLVTAIVAVMQKGGRKAKKIGGDNLPVSYAIYEVGGVSGIVLQRNESGL